MKRRVLSLIMALVILLTMLPSSALAQEMETPVAGASVEDTKGAPKATAPTTAPTVAVTASTEGSVPATEDSVLSTEGDIAPQNGKGIAVQSGGNVAKIGEEEYATLEDTLEDAFDGVEITLLDNATVEDELCTYYSTTIIMDGHSITGNIDAYGSLTLKGGTVTGNIYVDISDEGAFTMTAPADAAAAIGGDLSVIDGSCYISGAKVGVKGTLYFDGDDMVITGTDKAVELTEEAKPASNMFYGSTDVNGDTTEEATFEDGTYKVSGGVAKKLTNKQAGVTPTEPVTLTLTPAEQDGKAGTTIEFTAAYNGTDELNVYVQGNALEDYYFTFDQTNNGDGTRTISVNIDADVPTGDYTLYVHEVKDAFVQAKATIHVTGLPDVAEVGGVKYKSLPKALAAAKDGDTVTMLANHETDWDAVEDEENPDESTLAIVTKELTLDLNGKTVDYLMVGDIAFDEETQTVTAVYPGKLTVMSSREGGTAASTINALDFVKGTLDIQSGQIGSGETGLVCNGDSGSVTISGGTVLGLAVGEGASVTVSGGSLHGGNWSNEGTLNITGGTFNNVYFRNIRGTIAISGGTFGTIFNYRSSTEIPPMSLLKKGYAFYDRDDGTTLRDGSKVDYLANVTVKEHTHNIVDGKCDCGLAATVSDSKGDFYNTLQAALEAAAKDSTIEWVQPEQDLTEQVTFDAADAVVTVRMNGKTLTAPNNDAPAVAVSGGTLIFADAATISMPTTADPYNQAITYAVSISGGKLVFQGKLTAEGGVFNIPGNRTVQMPAVYANGGELDFQGDLDLKSGLTISGNAKLTRKLTQGIFRTDYMEGDRLSVTGSSNYKYLEYLLEDGYAFVDKDDHNVFRCVSSFTFWSGSDVTIVPHEHTWGPDGELYSCTACGKSCGHPDGYPDGKCPVCGKPCPHAIADQSPVDHKYYCNECHQKMVARIQTDTYAWSHFTNLKDAMAAAEDGQTVLLLDDIDNSGKRAVVTGDGKTVTLDLSGHSVTGGWIQAGYGEAWNDQSASTLKIVGSGSFINTGTYGNLSVGYKATLDLSGWVGANNTISRVSMSKRGGDEAELIVSENIGTIGSLGFNSWPSSGIKTKLTGGSYGEISIVVQYDSEPYSSMLAPGYAFQYIDTGDYVNYTKTATNQGNTIYNVKVVKCTHGGTNGFDYNSLTCPYCGTPAVAQTALLNVEGNPWRNFANLQDALDADRNGGSVVRLLADVTGEYTINGSTYTGLDLNGHSINGTVYVTGGGKDTSFSNSGSTGSVEAVIASAGAKLAGSGAPAIIGTLKLAEGATWENILQLPTLGYKVFNEDGTYKWYAPADVPAGSAELNNVVIGSLPITSNTLSFKVNGKNVSSVERGTTVQLCAYCNTSGADVAIYIGEPVNDGTFTFSKVEATYQKIGNSWYYVVDNTFNKIGKYGIYFTASKDGYSVASELKMLTVTKLKLSNAKIEFPNGNESVYQPYNTTTGVPPYVVTYNGNELKEGVDYTVVRGASRSSVGAATLTIKATNDGDYTGQKTAQWTVVAHKATISVGDIIKAYDGTTDLPANASIKLKSADSRYSPSGGPLPLVAGEGYQILNASYDSANASEDEKTVSFTIKLTDQNYTFEDGTTQKDFALNGAEVSQDFIINKAPAPVLTTELQLYVFNDLEKRYDIDLATLLPKLTPPCEYGDIGIYSAYSNLTEGYFGGVATAGSKVGLTIKKNPVSTTGFIGNMEVSIFTTNYGLIYVAIPVYATNKITLDQSGISVSATDITYGQTLADSTLTVTGSMICPRTQAVIPGTFAWTDATIMPNAGSYEAEWTFTPAEGYEEYAPATGKVTITVSPKSIEGAIVTLKADSFEYDGNDKTPVVESVVLDNVTLIFDTDYSFSYPNKKDAGTYDLYVTGNGNYTGQVAINWYITPKEVTPEITVASCSYTGDVLEPEVTLKDDLGNIIDPKEYEVSYSNNTNAGKGRVTIKDVEGGNYVIKGISQDFPISQAAAPTNIQTGTLNVINGTMLTYTYDFSQLLPELSKGEYGTVSYKRVSVTGLAQGYDVVGTARVNETTGALTLPFESVWDVSQLPPGSVAGIVNVYVYTQNFQPFVLVLDLYPIDQIKPVANGDITASEITYGDELSKSEISGAMKDPNTGETVTGTFTWTDDTLKLDAGDREAEWTFTPDAPEYAAVTGNVRVTVNPKSIEGAIVTLEEDSFVYDGTVKEPKIISVVLDGVTLTGPGRDKDYGFSYNRTAEVGTYDDFTVGGQNNYTGRITVTWSITPRPVTPTITVADGVYDGGNPVQPTVTLTDDLGNIIDPKEYDVSYSDNTGVGTGTVTITDRDGGNYILGTASTTFTIAKAPAPTLTAYPVTQKYTLKTEQTITLPDLKSLGMPSDAQVSDANAFHSGFYSPADKIANGWGVDVDTGAITYALADGVAAGDVITFTLQVRSNNYEDATVTVVLTLTERDTPILTLPDIITMDYTGAEIPVSAVTGKSAAFDGVDVPGTWSWKAGQAITNATDTGNKTIVFTPDDLVNYHPVEGEVYVIISRVAPDYTAPTAKDFLIYSGSAQTLVNAGSTAHGKLLYSLSQDGTYSEAIPTGTDAGEYTVWYKVEGDSNHTDTQPASVTVTVAPKTVTATVTVSGDSLTYTGDPLKPDIIVKDGDTVISPDEYDVSYKDNVNAGTATVTVKNKAGGNYTVSGSTTFEIGKAASQVKTAPTANTGLVYNGGEQTLVTTGTALGGKLKYRLGESGEFTAELPKAANAGTYTVYYMVEGDGNHHDSEVYSLTVTIDKAKVTVTALDKRIYTDDKAPDLSKPVADKDYAVSGLFGEDALTGDIKLTYVDASGAEITPDTTKVGQAIIRASGLTAPNDNYTVVFVDGKLTVDERPVYTIKATAGLHGSITPSGNVDVLHGGSQTFTIAASSGYAISNVKVDGVSIGAVKSYTFENVIENHTIEVTFMKANGNPQTGVMVDEVTGEYYVA